jgi:hypothetical protein
MISQMATTKFILKLALGYPKQKTEYTWEILLVVIRQLLQQRNISFRAMAAIIAVMPAIQAKN